MADQFTKNTFKYFDLAHKNKNNALWFEKNKSLYQEAVVQPMTYFLQKINQHIGSDLPRINIAGKAVSRPLRPANKIKEGASLIKNFSHFTLWEKKTSLFEFNPGIHFQVGHEKKDNFLGLGLYMISGRQLSLLRNAVVEDYETIDDLLENKKMKKNWGTLLGEKYKRFPKGFDQEAENSKYLWYKQFHLGKNLTRQEIIHKNFINKSVKELNLGMPFFKWVRQTVGTYSHRSHD